MDKLSIDRNDLLALESSLSDEWLETNGLGGYASSTVLNCHTRKYHGWLVAPKSEFGSKYVYLSKLEPSVMINKKEFLLSTNKYPGVFHPTGHQYMELASFDLCPVIHWKIGDTLLTQAIMMIQGMNLILVKYDLVNSEVPLTLRLKPLLAFRDFHSLAKENLDIQVKVFPYQNKKFKMEPYANLPPLYFTGSQKPNFYPGPCWFNNLEFWEENLRGFDYQEDLFCPGIFERKMKPGESFIMGASLSPVTRKIEDLWKKEIERRVIQKESESKEINTLDRLKFNSSKFFIGDRKKVQSITAGFPWFMEWGRDTMISIPGLTFYCDNLDKGFEILNSYSELEKNGVLPNTLTPDHLNLGYNSLDASLWYFWAVDEYLRCGGQLKKIKKLILPTMIRIIDSLINGTHQWAKVNELGLVEAGTPDTQLTWMDAQVNGKPVTPRHGMAIEINGLWLNALRVGLEIREKLDAKFSSQWSDLYQKGLNNFGPAFWDEEKSHFADVISEKGKDFSLRPNQVISLSFPFDLLARDKCWQALEQVKNELVTPFGLRSLSPKNSQYIGEYKGSSEQRDGAYHQGTVWSWLVGPYVCARLRYTQNKKSEANELLETFNLLFEQHPYEFGLGGISEIFDGNPPHMPRGCANQAWGVAECIRAQELIKAALK